MYIFLIPHLGLEGYPKGNCYYLEILQLVNNLGYYFQHLDVLRCHTFGQ